MSIATQVSPASPEAGYIKKQNAPRCRMWLPGQKSSPLVAAGAAVLCGLVSTFPPGATLRVAFPILHSSLMPKRSPTRDSPRKSSSSITAPILQAAFARHQQGQLAEAEAGYREVLQHDPNNFDALHLWGVLEHQRGRIEVARPLIERAIKVDRRNPSPHIVLGLILKQSGQVAEALASYDRALSLKPDLAEVHYFQGNALRELKRPAEALTSYDRALALRPNYPEALNNRGNALGDLKRHDEALDCYDRTLALRPDYFEALNNRGTTLRDLKRPTEALHSFDQALALQPNTPATLTNRGAALQDLRRHAEALDCFARAIAIQPALAMAHTNESVCRLQTGDFAEGWEKFEWRWETEAFQPVRRQFAQPLWRGRESLRGSTILLHAEQGLGDTIQFCRYASLVSALGARVVLEVQPSLKRLLAGLPGIDHLLSRGESLPTFDYHCPLLTLPLAFQARLDSIPQSQAYVRGDPALTSKWENRIGTKERRRIGLVWSGSMTPDPGRSIPLADFAPLLSAPFHFIGLQQEVRTTDQIFLEQRQDLVNLGAELGDFADTAALIEALDLVITVDTSVAHLAGAMGKPVWILLLYNSDWRWLLDRDDSPWYPSARLFRQTENGSWRSVIARVAAELKNMPAASN